MSDTIYGKFFINEDGHARVELTNEIDPNGLINDFLRVEIGGFIKTCSRYLTNVQSLLEDQAYRQEMTGNLYTISFDKRSIRIMNVYDEAYWTETSPQIMLGILTQWQELINSPDLKQ